MAFFCPNQLPAMKPRLDLDLCKSWVLLTCLVTNVWMHSCGVGVVEQIVHGAVTGVDRRRYVAMATATDVPDAGFNKPTIVKLVEIRIIWIKLWFCMGSDRWGLKGGDVFPSSREMKFGRSGKLTVLLWDFCLAKHCYENAESLRVVFGICDFFARLQGQKNIGPLRKV